MLTLGDGQSTYKKTFIKKPDAVRDILFKVVHENTLFKELTPNEKTECVDAFYQKIFNRGELVIEEGETGETFYVLLEGTADALKMKWQPIIHDSAPSKVATYQTGGSFGELALLYHEPRAATIRVTSAKAECWAIDRGTFKAIHMHFKMQRVQDYETKLRKVPGMSKLSSLELGRILESVHEVTFQPGDTILSEGKPNDGLWVCLEGTLARFKSSTGESARGGPGDFYEEHAILKSAQGKALATLKALTEATLIKILKRDVDEIVIDFEKLTLGKDKRPVSLYPKSKNSAAKKNAQHR